MTQHDHAAPAPEHEAAGTLEAEADPVAVLTAERDDMRDRLLRAVAETENLRKRAERETADARVYAVTKFARDVLATVDNLGRALESVPAEARANAEGPLKSLLEGVELTARDLETILQRHGVTRIEAAGARFDPNLHQAIFEAPDPSVPKGTVVQVVQEGFTLAGRTLRPAMVGVSAGGPKAPAANGG